MMTPERRICETIRKKITIPHFYFKISDRFTRGMPDCLFITAPNALLTDTSKHLWIEYKIYPNKPSPLQLDKINELTKFNQFVWVITARQTNKPITYKIHDMTAGIIINDTTDPWTDIMEFLK